VIPALPCLHLQRVQPHFARAAFIALIACPTGCMGAGRATEASSVDAAVADASMDARSAVVTEAAPSPDDVAASPLPMSDADAPSQAESGVPVDDGDASDGGAGEDAQASADAEPEASAEAGAACGGLLCEDFEQGQLDPTRWDVQTGAGGTLSIESDLAAHGRYAMHVHGLAGPADYALIVTKNAPSALAAGAFGRAYFFITPKPLTSGHTQMTFAGSDGTGTAEGPGPFSKLRYMEVANINGGWQIGFDLLDVSPLVEEVAYPAGSPQVPVMTWSCLEWQYSDEPDVVNLWVDGAAIGTFDNEHVSYPGGHTPGSPLYQGTSSGLIGRYSVFGFGFHDWHPNKPFDLYYDDIVLDTKRVGCLR
jgi:hypothetical protein